MRKLFDKPIEVKTPGKAILTGEHAVIYGQEAIALCLPDIFLSLKIDHERVARSWNDAWHRDGLALSSQEKLTLNKCLGEALRVNGLPSLNHFEPQSIHLASEIPLGAGMGSSAALSISLMKLVHIAFNKVVSTEDLAQQANAIDSLFHGKSSGIDTATIASGGAVVFSRAEGVRALKNKFPFHVVLIDSGERTPTAAMISLVELQLNNLRTKSILSEIGQLSQNATRELQSGSIGKLGTLLLENHLLLAELGVSHAKVNNLVDALMKKGAVGAKMTGGGGGGLALAIFENRPQLDDLKTLGPVYATYLGV